MKNKLQLFLFANGNTAFFVGNEQGTTVQHKGWLQLQLEYIESCGYNPLDVEIHLPDGQQAKAFLTEVGYNWHIGNDIVELKPEYSKLIDENMDKLI